MRSFKYIKNRDENRHTGRSMRSIASMSKLRRIVQNYVDRSARVSPLQCAAFRPMNGDRGSRFLGCKSCVGTPEKQDHKSQPFPPQILTPGSHFFDLSGRETLLLPPLFVLSNSALGNPTTSLKVDQLDRSIHHGEPLSALAAGCVAHTAVRGGPGSAGLDLGALGPAEEIIDADEARTRPRTTPCKDAARITA